MILPLDTSALAKLPVEAEVLLTYDERQGVAAGSEGLAWHRPGVAV